MCARFLSLYIALVFPMKLIADTVSFRIAFGSCARENRPQMIWNTILEQNPDAFLFIGDNIYGDTLDPQNLRDKYALLQEKPEFKAFRTQVPIFATWDDHDYGANDAGSEFPIKRQSQQAFLDFLRVPENSPRRQQEGVYSSEIFEWGQERIQVLLLDTRYFRSPLEKGDNGYKPHIDPEATILGPQQWAWLEQELRKPADLRIIASSIQLLSKEHRYEKWDNFPLETERLLNLIASTRAEGVLFISGDRHHGELSVLQDSRIAYPLYDFTSSGMTEGSTDQVLRESNQRRVPKTSAHRVSQFGLIELSRDDKSDAIQVTLTLRDELGRVRERLQFPLNKLRRAAIAKR